MLDERDIGEERVIRDLDDENVQIRRVAERGNARNGLMIGHQNSTETAKNMRCSTT